MKTVTETVDSMKLNSIYNNDTACAQFIGTIADTLKERPTVEKSTQPSMEGPSIE